MANPLIADGSSEYQAKLLRAAEALEALDPYKRMGSRCFAAHNRMGNTSSVIFAPLRENPETQALEVLLQLRPETEVWPKCWGLPASALNAGEKKEEVLARMAQGLGCQLKTAVQLYKAEWYMDGTESPWEDPQLAEGCNERGSYYHYPFYVEFSGEPKAGERGWQWHDVNNLPTPYVVHHIQGALMRTLKYLAIRAKYDAAIKVIEQIC